MLGCKINDMVYGLILLAQLGGLFLLSNQLVRLLNQWFMRLTGSIKISTWLLALFFLLGTFIHELSHLVVARLLLVRAGSLTVLPHIEQDHIVMGSVLIAPTDRLRRLIIGIAPGIVGLAIIFGSLWLAQEMGWWTNWYWRIGLGYLVFQVGNSLFSSKADLEGALGLVIFVGLVAGALYWLGVRPSFDWVEPFLNTYQQVLELGVKLFWVPLIIDAVGIGVTWVLVKLWGIR